MRTFLNYCREDCKPKYFSMTLNGLNFVYSHKDDLNDWKAIEKLAGNICKSGLFKDINSNIEVVSWIIEEGSLKQQPGEMRELTNTKGL